ncbi:class I SAM-dependent methyltransferase [Donghicola sp. C2-DW-16]|uniref:Class I SAM-dependent methyltransferase n=1 Tax=Donghicola mangrovi TaxID=2729614 RepID=A0ABX2PBH8_9RHOB|nr:class I SAM-dependent methyltransferase [Donghicola mangrovi]NVO26733.1 class I SAM-dependent methyltransferase [Donghicola mangrovi]
MSREADEITGLYRRHAQAWARLRGSEPQEEVWLEKFVQLLPASGSVLDIGSGSGKPIGQYLFDKGFAVTGIDASPELIEISRRNLPECDWLISDMRDLQLDKKFNGIVAWNSSFHLTPNGQRQMFPVFERHAAPAATLMFTSGPCHGDAIGEFEGEPLYHSSLDSEEYRTLLDRHGFGIIDHIVEDERCGLHTVWLCRYRDTV